MDADADDGLTIGHGRVETRTVGSLARKGLASSISSSPPTVTTLTAATAMDWESLRESSRLGGDWRSFILTVVPSFAKWDQ